MRIKKSLDIIGLIWLIGAIMGSVLLIVSVVLCEKNPLGNIANFMKIFIGPVDYSYIIALPLGFFIVWTVIFAAIRNIIKKAHNKTTIQTIEKKPDLTSFAKIVFKNSVTNTNRKTTNIFYVYDTLTITFEIPDGRRLVFPVTQEQYSQYLENDVGTLTYKECDGQLTFVNFERQVQSAN